MKPSCWKITADRATILLCAAALLFSWGGCQRKPAAPSYPTGLWEYLGPLQDGREVVYRVTVEPGPFVRDLGYAAPNQPLSVEAYSRLPAQLEKAFVETPEMMMRFENGRFHGIGSDFDGEVFLELDPATGALISRRGLTSGIVLKPVTAFSPFAFPEFARRLETPTSTEP